ncbi:MAG: LysM peptidoglycan-binding domain-containing protein [Clostridia bacterium]|nr:LysM peptidoglycan-binding domain-containing protein [Clostridia bacterium]
MENNEMINNELNVNELEEAVGGSGGSPRMLPEKDHYVVYKIRKGDTLSFLAYDNRCTVADLMRANPTIKNRNDITAGYYIYLPTV